MKRYFFAFFLLSTLVQAQVSPKRGIAYGYHSVADLTAIHQGTSWWYNWSASPDAAVAGNFSTIGMEFVPMCWNASFDVNTLIANIPAGAKYLLAFNEPNFNVEANMTPQQAVNNWSRVEQIAAARNLEIVSAAPAYGDAGSCIPGYTSPITWHDEFFALCPTCKVDYIAFHCYENTTGGLFALVNNLKKYNRPIWLTEFACWDPGINSTTKNNYLTTAVSTFENDPDIYRYSWFTGRRADNTTINLFGAGSGTLTTLGTSYVNAAYGPQHTIPGQIQAETHYRRRGTDLENTTDAGGGQNVGWTDAGDWNEYIVDVNATGAYTFQFRVASQTTTANFDILLDDQVVKSAVTFAPTGGYQTWTTISVTGVPLTVGEHLLKLRFNNGGFNINYFNTVFESNLPPSANFSASVVSTCAGNQITFTDLTTNKTGAETYSWNFGPGASPTTASTVGPHVVTYSTGGQKTITLTVTNAYGSDVETKSNYITVAAPPSGCLFADDYNNSTVNWLTNGAFSYAESGTLWTVSNGGYGEWENFRYTLNDGNNAVPLNFQCAANKPKLTIRARSTANCLLSVSLVDANGRAVDNYNAMNLELTTTQQTFTIDFQTHFRNYYSGNPGILDSSNIAQIQFSINPGFYSYPIVGTNATYNSYFPGNVIIDWIGIGDNSCMPPALTAPSISGFSPSCLLSGTTVTINGTNLDNATAVQFNGIGATILSNSATQITATAPNGITSGKISITNAGGSGQSVQNFHLSPVTSSITGANAVCSGSTGNNFNVTNTAGSTYNWTLPSGASVTAGSGSNAITMTSGTVSGNVSVSETNADGCTGASVQKSITVLTLPAANAGGDQTVTVDNTTLSATGSGSWSVVSGTGTFTNATSATTSVSGLSIGLNRFQWSVSDGTCSNADQVDITYNSVLALDPHDGILSELSNEILQQQIAPNPFMESTSFLIPGEKSGEVAISILDARGVEISSGYFESGQLIEVGKDLKSGIYLLKISDGREIRSVRIVKK